MSKSIKKVASVALPIIGTAVGASFGMPQLGAILGGAAGGAAQGKGLKGIALGAASGFAGNVAGKALGGSLTSTLSKVGASNAFTNSLANTGIGRLASNVVGPATGSSLIGNTLGSFAGNSLASSVADSFSGGEQQASSSGPAPFSPSRDPKMELPSSLSSFGNLAPEQQSSNVATQGVYGGGNGPEEQQWFQSMINNKLIDDSGNVDKDLSDISPIENSYLSQLGLGGYGNATDLLEALSKRRNNGVPA